MSENTEDLPVLEFSLGKASPDYNQINSRIQEIIKKRRALVSKVEPIHQHLYKLYDEIAGLDDRRKHLVNTIDDVVVAEKLNGINFNELKGEIQTYIKQLDLLKIRFSRDTLNIGVVGRMGQGKSTFLKSLSGLSDNEIPAREGTACTAVRSKIFHHDGETEATVIYHSKSTFLEEVLGEYYRELGLGDLATLEDFANQFLGDSPQRATHEQMYKRLKDDYKSTYPRYSQHLKDGAPRPQKIRTQDIPKYVSQQRDAQQRLTSFEHLAVREVEIRCPFPKIEVHSLGLVDVPGLGDTRVADENLILRTLAQEVDVVLFFRKPDIDRYQWEKEDLKLYEIAAQALDNLSNRSFMVLNHRRYGDKDNIRGCNLLKGDMQTMRVAESPIIADCSNPDEANDVLELVLKYLDKNIVEIEEQYARSYQNRLIKVHGSINTELEKAKVALAAFAGGDKQFGRKFNETIGAISIGLTKMLEELWSQQGTIDTDFEVEVSAALQRCRIESGIPPEEEIERRTPLPGNKNRYEVVHGICAVELRCQLSKNFLSLEQGLIEASDKLRMTVAKVLTNENCLNGLAKYYGVQDVAFLEKLTEILADRDNKLELGFQTLLNFKMSYGSLIMESIRLVLDNVIGGVRANSKQTTAAAELISSGSQVVGTAVKVAAQIGTGMPGVEAVQAGFNAANAVVNAVANQYEITDAASVHKSLQNLHRTAVEQCKQTLDKWLKLPSRLRYYMAEEFIDRILYDKDIEEEWRHFLNDPEIQSQIWVEFKQIEERKQVHIDWLNAIKRTQELNQRKSLEFIS